MYEGESKTLEVQEVDSTDIEGQDITWILADEVGDTAEIEKTTTDGGISITDGANGKFEITLDPSDTDGISGRFYQEARIDDGAGTESVLFSGEVIIHQSGTN